MVDISLFEVAHRSAVQLADSRQAFTIPAGPAIGARRMGLRRVNLAASGPAVTALPHRGARTSRAVATYSGDAFAFDGGTGPKCDSSVICWPVFRVSLSWRQIGRRIKGRIVRREYSDGRSSDDAGIRHSDVLLAAACPWLVGCGIVSGASRRSRSAYPADCRTSVVTPGRKWPKIYNDCHRQRLFGPEPELDRAFQCDAQRGYAGQPSRHTRHNRGLAYSPAVRPQPSRFRIFHQHRRRARI